MAKRYAAIWFRYLITDRLVIRQPELSDIPFVTAGPERGRVVVRAANRKADEMGVCTGMGLADAKAIFPALYVVEDKPDLAMKLLRWLAEWCLRFTPTVAVDAADGLILEATGCPHLWGGEYPYLKDIVIRLRKLGFNVRVAIADTIGTAWAIARFGKAEVFVKSGGEAEALKPLPPAALRLPAEMQDRLEKLGLYHIGAFINMPRRVLYRRFGQALLSRIDQALGREQEPIEAIRPANPFLESLPCLEPIVTSIGIEIALRKLLERICRRLAREEKGLRKCLLKAYRVDGNVQQLEIGTVRPSRNIEHLFKLFEIKVSALEPALGFELFAAEALIVEDVSPEQEALWDTEHEKNGADISELLDRVANKVGRHAIHFYMPDEHYWPERSIKEIESLQKQLSPSWPAALTRPIHLLAKPELITVTVAIPDYPPILFRYRGEIHRVRKADGPERIEQEWWLDQSLYRDYYIVEDEAGLRYWIFRLGHYGGGSEPKWFLHGFFA